MSLLLGTSKARRRVGELDSQGYVVTWPDLRGWPDPPLEWPLCDDCGLVHYTVKATARDEVLPSCASHTNLGLPCRQLKAFGLERCARHSPSRTVSKKKHLARKTAEKSLAEVRVKALGNPIDHLADLAAESLALKGHLADTVAQLKDRYRFTDDKGAEHLDARVALYERSMDRAAKFLGDLVKIGFEEKRLQLEERRARVVRTFIIGVLTSLNLDPNTPEVRNAIEQWAGVLDGDAPPDIIEAKLTDDDD